MLENRNVTSQDFGDFALDTIEVSFKDDLNTKKTFGKLVFKDTNEVFHFIGPIEVVPLDNGIYLISGVDKQMLIRKEGKELKYNQFERVATEYYYNYFDEVNECIHEGTNEELEFKAYKLTENMLKLGVIVLRVGTKYNLINFRTGDSLLAGYDNFDVSEENVIKAEMAKYKHETASDIGYDYTKCYPEDVLVGVVTEDWQIRDNQLVSQKYGVSILCPRNEKELEQEYFFATIMLENNPKYEFNYALYRSKKERK